MRSILSTHSMSVHSSMPGHYKSCRRSTGELFSKEQGHGEQNHEIKKCALPEVFVKDDTEQALKAQEVTPPKLTPLKWRSTSMMELNNALGANGSGSAAKHSIPIHPEPMQSGVEVKHPQSSKGLSLSQQASNFPSAEQVTNVRLGRGVSHAQLLEPTNAADGKGNISINGLVNSPKSGRFGPKDSIERSPECRVEPGEIAVNSMKTEDQVNAPEGKETFANEEYMKTPVSRGSVNGVYNTKPEEQENSTEKKKIVTEILADEEDTVTPVRSRSVNADPIEEIVFRPVDLDKKYRTEELVRHVTAAKIQNREEALLNNPSPHGINGKSVPAGQEPAAMTIEFLRARLQAERSASKTTKLRMEQLSKKVIELESKLLSEVELRKSAEFALQDALSKLKKHISQGDQGVRPDLIPGPVMAADAGVQKNDEMATSASPESKEAGKSMSGPVEDVVDLDSSVKDEKKLQGRESAAKVGEQELPSTSKEISGSDGVTEGGLWRDRSVQSKGQGSLQATTKTQVVENGATKVLKASGSGLSSEQTLTPSRQRQDMRADIEERLRSLWSKIREEMATLAEVQGDGETDQFLAFLENKQNTGDVEPGTNQRRHSSEGRLGALNPQTDGVDANGSISQEQMSSKVTDATEKRSKSFTRNASLAKNVAKLVEQFEFQETAQREWEEDFEARQLLEQNENVVTKDGDVVSETGSDLKVQYGKGSLHSQGERNSKMPGGAILRSKSLGFLPSQQGVKKRNHSRKGSSNGLIEIIPDNPTETWVDDEQLLFDPETEMAEELPNGIYLHHSRDDIDPHRRTGRDVMYRKTPERVDRQRGDGHRGMGPWQDGIDAGLGSRGMSQNHYGFPPSYVMDESRQTQFAQPSPYGEPRLYGDGTGYGSPYGDAASYGNSYSDAPGYGSRRDMQYMNHGQNNSRFDYYPPNVPTGIPQQRPSMGRYMPPDRPPMPQGHGGWVGFPPHQERPAPMGVPEETPGEASQVLKALRIAKQQIKSSTIEQAAVMTAQYTVSQEHRYGAGGQVSKTSYTVEAPVGYPHVSKTFHEGWQLAGKPASKKRGGLIGSNGDAIDLSSNDVTEVSTAAPLTGVNGESSYVEKLNVGRGIQFFFTG